MNTAKDLTLREILKTILPLPAYRVLLVAIAIIFFFITFDTFNFVKVNKDMIPTYEENQTLVCAKTHNFSYGDVVAYKSALAGSDAYIIRRVYGLPGDTVTIDGNDLIINGEEIIDDFAYYDSNKEGFQGYTSITLKEGEVFLMGDNRNWSIDSRVNGAMDESLIAGKIIWSF